MADCDNSQYALFIDGDYALNVDALISYLRTHGKPALIGGKVWASSAPRRLPSDPHYLSYDFYPYSRFPPFIAAGAIIISRDLVQPLHIFSYFTKHVPFDDVFYGLVAKKLGLTLTDLSDLLPSWWSVPAADDTPRLRTLIATHRFGNLAEVERIHHALQMNHG